MGDMQGIVIGSTCMHAGVPSKPLRPQHTNRATASRRSSSSHALTSTRWRSASQCARSSSFLLSSRRGAKGMALGGSCVAGAAASMGLRLAAPSPSSSAPPPLSSVPVPVAPLAAGRLLCPVPNVADRPGRPSLPLGTAAAAANAAATSGGSPPNPAAGGAACMAGAGRPPACCWCEAPSTSIFTGRPPSACSSFTAPSACCCSSSCLTSMRPGFRPNSCMYLHTITRGAWGHTWGEAWPAAAKRLRSPPLSTVAKQSMLDPARRLWQT